MKREKEKENLETVEFPKIKKIKKYEKNNKKIEKNRIKNPLNSHQPVENPVENFTETRRNRFLRIF